MASERKYFFDSTCVALALGRSTTSQAVQRFYEEKIAQLRPQGLFCGDQTGMGRFHRWE